MTRLTSLALAAASIAFAPVLAAQAQVVDTTTFQVRATVVPVCTVQATNIDFGVYRANQAAPTDATGSITVRCTLNTPFKLSLNGGTVTGSSILNRLLSSGANTVAYQLYVDAGRTQIWGDGAQGVSHSGVGTGTSTSVTMHARMPPLQFQPAGIYTDTITVTLEY
jgi:spore coat protein U-like protein